MTLLPVTLAAAAAAAVLNIWLSLRIGAVRQAAGISIGDGGSDALHRRMRAQMNFVENTPFVLALIIAIELSDKGGLWLPIVAGIYFLARIAHGIGMDGGTWAKGRMIGTIVTMLTQLGLAAAAVLIVLKVIQ
ncbi:MAG: MAPEG family protein [Pseudomonadota bacterium]